MAFEWKGVFPAVLTAFTETGELDISTTRHHWKCHLDAGVQGLIIGGSLGEASTLTREEKFTLCKEALELVAARVPVIMNIAESATAEAISQAKAAMAMGVNGLMLLPPMRYKSDDRETVEYFKAVAYSCNLPVMIYNNPVDYKIEVTVDMFAQLAEVPNITAIKESTRDITNITRLRNRLGNRYAILCGVDTLAMEELLMGADGLVAGLVDAFPKETVVLYEWIQQGRLDEARTLYRWFMPLLELDIHPKLVQYIKLAASHTGTCTPYVRAPRLMLEGAELEKVEAIVTAAIKTRPALN